jgi:hypothetical protein
MISKRVSKHGLQNLQKFYCDNEFSFKQKLCFKIPHSKPLLAKLDALLHVTHPAKTNHLGEPSSSTLDTRQRLWIEIRKRLKRTTIPFCRIIRSNMTEVWTLETTPHSSPTYQPLNLEDKILVRGVDCNIPGFWRSQKYELFKTFLAMSATCSR